MFEIIKNIIERGGFDLEKLLRKIDIYHAEDKLAGEQRAELIGLAREHADPHSSYGAWQTVLDELAVKIAALEKRIAALEQGSSASNPNGSQEEWPEYVPPTGAHNAYMKGDKVTFRGKHYISKEDNNVWSPYAYPAYWQAA